MLHFLHERFLPFFLLALEEELVLQLLLVFALSFLLLSCKHYSLRGPFFYPSFRSMRVAFLSLSAKAFLNFSASFENLVSFVQSSHNSFFKPQIFVSCSFISSCFFSTLVFKSRMPSFNKLI